MSVHDAFPPSDPTPSRENARLGRYVLVREIARSNDVVWEANDPQMNRRVAVKELMLPATLYGQARRERIERFYREARAAGAMSHPHIVTIYEVGEDNGRYFLAMEYLEGQTLRERLGVGGPMPLGEVSRIVSALCDALGYAHGRGVIHRDIKPDNVHLLPGGTVKLTDFGIARITHEDALTVDGQVFGTPSYMSPEQVAGRGIDARSDIFSLGIVIYEMLTGKKPFAGDSVITITYRIMNDEMPPLLLGLPGAAPVLDAVLRRALAKDPEGRYHSPAELQVAFGTAIQGHNPLLAAPYTPGPPETATMTIAYPGRPNQETGEPASNKQSALTGTQVFSAPPHAAPRNSGRARTATRNLLTVVVSVVLLVGLTLGGAWTLSQAFQNYQRQGRIQTDVDGYTRASELYKQGTYDAAADRFRRLRQTSVDATVRRAATLSEAICYRALGGRFFRQNNLAAAERMFREAERLFLLSEPLFEEALRADPDNDKLVDSLGQAQQGIRQARQELNAVLRARGAPPEAQMPEPVRRSSEPPGPSSAQLAPSSTRPRVSGADFQNANAERARQATRFLEAGNRALSRGETPEALQLWGKAEQAGPGSSAAVEARQRINAYSPQTNNW